MNDKQKLLREHGMKSFKFMMILLVVSFFACPFIFWKDISQFNTTQLATFFILDIVGFVGIFCLFLYRYNKYENMDGNDSQQN
jgi:hypothetical protein